MVKLLKQTVALIWRQQTDILSAASIIMGAVAVSRILGLYRDRLLASRFSPDELGVYYASFRLPNMMFELLVMGALATAFIPVFTNYLDTKGKEEAFRMATIVMNIGLLFFLLALIPLFLFTPQLSRFLAPGFSSEELIQMTSFTRIMMVAQVFPLIIGNFLTGILQSFRQFLIPALAPVVYNVGIVVAIIFLTPLFGLSAPVIGVVLGAILFVLIQIPSVFLLGFRPSGTFSFAHPGAREVGKLMLPRTLGLAVSQIDATVDLILETLLGTGAVTIFNFAQHLGQVPVGLFGASIAQATLPTLSSCYAKNNLSEFRKIFATSLHQIFFLIIPLSSLLIVLRIPIVRLVFGASNLFDWNSTVLTGKTLAFFSVALFAQGIIHLTARGFYALHDSVTPVAVGSVAVIFNAVLSGLCVLVFGYPVWSLGLSASVASILHASVLLFLFDQKVKLDRFDLIFPIFKITLSGAVAGVALYIPIKLLDQLVFDTTRTINLFLLTGISMGAGLSMYLLCVWFLDVPQAALLIQLLRRAKQRTRGVIFDTTQEVVNTPSS